MIIHVAKDFILSYTLYDVKLDLFPNIAIKHEVRNSFLAILCKIEKQMFDAWGISIFVGFDFHNVDALRLKSRKMVRASQWVYLTPGPMAYLVWLLL